jgi:hypothetical protein
MNNTPPELGPHVWSLDYTPDASGHPDLPELSPNWPKSIGDYPLKRWDPSLLGIEPTIQFIQNADPANNNTWVLLENAITNAAMPVSGYPNPGQKILTWSTGTAQERRDFIAAELGYLLELMEDQRDRYLPELAGQADGAPGYWLTLLGIEQGERPNTVILMATALRIGEMIAMHFKRKYQRVRPSTLAPGLLVPFGPPAHASFPSGHATQCMLMSLSLRKVKEIDDRYGDELDWLAQRVAKGRERAGLHYPSDTLCGFALASEAIKWIDFKTPDLDLLVEVKNEWQ